MFVRTKKGKIFDCVVHELMGKPIYYPKTSKTNGYIDWNEVYKKSENIIDVLEVGDYVNGSKVIKTNCKLEYIDDDCDTGVNEVYDGLETEKGWIYFEHEIETIVTKEMFESISYRVGSEE